MSYQAEHDSALADITAAGGIALTFTRTSPGTYDPLTDTTSAATVTTVAGRGIIVRGDPQRYRALELTLSTAPTLLFAPTTYPLQANTTAMVQPGDTVVLNNATLTVRDVEPVAPDGNVIVARIIVGA